MHPRHASVLCLLGALLLLESAACSDSSSGTGPRDGANEAGATAGEGGASSQAGSGGASVDRAGQDTGGSAGTAQAGNATDAGAGGELGNAAGSGNGVERCSAGQDGTLACASPRLLVGTAVNMTALEVPAYAQLLSSEFNYVTPENVMKWGPLQPTADAWDFSPADQLLELAEQQGQQVKGHVLVWHVQQPDWAGALTAPQLRDAVQAHIARVVPHFKGRLRAWDVVNEAILDGGGGIRPGLHTVLGVSGMADAFKQVREADPDAKLYYNDYGIELMNDKSDAVYRLIQDLQAAGAPIDGIGFQSHLSSEIFPSLEGLRANIARFAALGLTVNISELDVRTVAVPGTKAQRLASQAVVYQEVAAACALEPACEAITLWGFTDAYSWIDSEYGADDPLPWDEAYDAKPAQAALLAGLTGKPAKAGAELVVDGGCETGAGWSGFGGATLGVVANGRTGNACRATARSEPYHGPGVSLTGKVPQGATVSVRGYARLAGAAGGRVSVILKKVEPGVADEYWNLDSRAVSNGDWTLLTANFTLGFATAPSELTLYFESPAVNATFPNLLVDDVTVKILKAD
jgi:GH35 family endo-1,4-beta-xylanase